MNQWMGQPKEKTMSTAELHKLCEKDGVRAGKFFSVAPRQARMEIVGPDWVCWVTVVDPDP
jgi:hypothetical protein